MYSTVDKEISAPLFLDLQPGMLGCGSYFISSLMTLSIVLPCYNEEENIAHTTREVAQWMRSQTIEGEIIIVDDGSKDGSAAILKHLEQEFPKLVHVVHRAKNGGYGIAVRDGCDAAKTEWIAFMDSDGQFKPQDLEKLIAFTSDYSFVTGRRAHRADSFVRNTFGKVLGAMNFLVLGLWVRDVNCGMKMFRKDVWLNIRPVHGVEKLFNTEMFLNLKNQNIPWYTVNVPHYPRRAGTPTGGSVKVILRMFQELWNLKRAQR